MKSFSYRYLWSILAIAVLFSSCGKEEEVVEEILKPIKYQEVGTADSFNQRTFSGTAQSGDEIDLSFRNSGIVTVLNISVGQEVKKGALLAKLDNVSANLAYEQSGSALSTAKSSMYTAKSNLDRVRSLYEKGSTSLSDYEQARNNYQTAKDQYDSALKSRDIRRTEVEYGFIYAPKDGVIAVKSVETNENVSAGQLVGVMNAEGDLEVRVGLPETVINKTELGMKTDMKFSAIENESYVGVVKEISPVIDGNTALYPVKLNIEGDFSKIKPGMAANITFSFNNEEIEDNAMIIPVKSVGEDGKGNFVFVVNSKDGKVGTVEKRPIEIGTLTSNGFHVLKGLKLGDKIAVAGLQTLLDGQKVKLQ